MKSFLKYLIRYGTIFFTKLKSSHQEKKLKNEYFYYIGILIVILTVCYFVYCHKNIR